jgi:hypothetical protein
MSDLLPQDARRDPPIRGRALVLDLEGVLAASTASVEAQWRRWTVGRLDRWAVSMGTTRCDHGWRALDSAGWLPDDTHRHLSGIAR